MFRRRKIVTIALVLASIWLIVSAFMTRGKSGGKEERVSNNWEPAVPGTDIGHQRRHDRERGHIRGGHNEHAKDRQKEDENDEEEEEYQNKNDDNRQVHRMNNNPNKNSDRENQEPAADVEVNVRHNEGEGKDADEEIAQRDEGAEEKMRNDINKQSRVNGDEGMMRGGEHIDGRIVGSKGSDGGNPSLKAAGKSPEKGEGEEEEELEEVYVDEPSKQKSADAAVQSRLMSTPGLTERGSQVKQVAHQPEQDQGAGGGGGANRLIWESEQERNKKLQSANAGKSGAAVVVSVDSKSRAKAELKAAVAEAQSKGTGGEEEGWKKYAHNEGASRKISLRRKLADVRDRACAEIQYTDSLPDASVIIVFYNEAWSTLLRTVHSVIDRSPSNLLTEVILVDDFSDLDQLKQPLDDYIELLPKVRIIRSERRQGVAKARQLGADGAKGKVLIFLDSHCECSIGWLEPLLSRISESPLSVVIPVMDVIDDDTFAYRPFDLKSINIGGFDWNLQFMWISVFEREKKRRTNEIDPIRTPTMSGGMFAIDRQRFINLGGFDVDMDQWGGENLEMSFKTWMCGGMLETIPCSHVGHLFRKRATYKMAEGGNPRKNFQRLAEVWMDDYKEQYYQNIGNAGGAFGDVTERKKLRESLACKSFSWYLKNVYPELFVPADALASGQIRNKEKGFGDGASFTACIDSVVGATAYNKPLNIWPCHNQGGNQVWMLSKFGEIRRDESCLDYAGTTVVIYPCHGQKGNQQWDYQADNTIRHIGTKLCLELSQDARSVAMAKCTRTGRQIWYWERNKKYYQAPENDEVGGAVNADGEAAQELAKDY